MPEIKSKQSVANDRDSNRLPVWGWALRRVLAHAFRYVSRSFFRVRVRGLEHFTNQPATLVVANHKSDLDTIILLPSLYWAHQGSEPTGRMRFVAAEQMFQPAYVAMYLMHRWPKFAKRLLYPANLSAVLKALGAYPIPQRPDRKLNLHLRALLDRYGDQTLGDLLNDPVSELFPGAADDLTITEALSFRWRDTLDQPFHLDRFKSSWARAAKTAYLRDAQQSLEYFIAALNRGDGVFIAPEGMLECDGKFLPVKAGVTRLVHRARRPVTLLPVNITYDTMTTGRPTAFVSIGPEQKGIDRLSRHEMQDLITRSIVKMNTVTLPQLAAHALTDSLESSPCTVHEQEFSSGLFDHACVLHLRNFAVDDALLHERSFYRRWRRFVKWCLRHRLAVRVGKDHLRFEPDSPITREQANLPGRSHWRFAANELRSAVQDVDLDREPASAA